MTAQEAVHLVLCAGAMAKGGEAFVLDMGKSIKILDLINKMINLLGFTVKNKKNPKPKVQLKGNHMYVDACLFFFSPTKKNNQTKHFLKISAYHEAAYNR